MALAHLRPGPPGRTPLRLVGAPPIAPDDAYAALAAAPGPWAGWKLGGVNAASRAAFRTERLYFGPLAPGEVMRAPARPEEPAPGLPLPELKGEAEVALRIAPGGRGFDAWALAIEMPASPIADLVEAGLGALLADRCAAGALLLGPPEPPDTLSGLVGARIAIEVDGGEVAAGGLETLTDAPAALLEAFLDEAWSRGFAPGAGDWVATGGATPCVAIPDGARLRLLCDGAAVLAFTASRDGGR